MPKEKQIVVPLERNGQTISLHQRKFFVAIPFIYSTAGYGFLLNMPGNGEVTIGTLVRMHVPACVVVVWWGQGEVYPKDYCEYVSSITLCVSNHAHALLV